MVMLTEDLAQTASAQICGSPLLLACSLLPLTVCCATSGSETPIQATTSNDASNSHRACAGRGFTNRHSARHHADEQGEMWYWVFLWCLFSSLFVHGAMGLLMLILLQRHRWGRLITVVLVSGGFLASLSGGVITSAAVAGVYRVAGKNMAPLEALVLGVGQTMLSIIISFSRVLATL
ncbi:transmembrane protein 170B isoform X1 [Oryzias latipes]